MNFSCDSSSLCTFFISHRIDAKLKVSMNPADCLCLRIRMFNPVLNSLENTEDHSAPNTQYLGPSDHQCFH